MVFINNVLASAAALASTLPLVLGSAVLPQAQDSESSIFARQSTWDEYHQLNGIYAEQGLCRYYLDPTGRDGLWPCKQFCNSNSVTCNGGGGGSDASTIGRNPDGERYVPGKCSCGNPILETVVKFTAEGLAELPGITCAVWLEALKQSVELGSWVIPGAGPAAKAAKTIVKTVKRADKIGGKSGWESFIMKTCGVDSWDFDISQAFQLAEQAEEE